MFRIVKKKKQESVIAFFNCANFVKVIVQPVKLTLIDNQFHLKFVNLPGCKSNVDPENKMMHLNWTTANQWVS